MPTLAFALACAAAMSVAVAAQAPAAAPAPGSIVHVGSTLVSAMMMFLGNEEKVYILDKAEGNPTHIGTGNASHPAWGSVWDIASNTAIPLEVESNTFCASGLHLPNGSYATFGGNHAVSPGPHDWKGPAGTVDPIYQDEDGRKAVRIMNPCTGNSAAFGPACQWFDEASELQMERDRWYSTAEALADGTIVLLGGMVNGGFINRHYPVKDAITQGGDAENTYEFYPRRPGFNATVMNFLVEAGGLNTYPLAYLMPSGKMFLQANLTTILWDPDTNEEFPLPNMPNNVVRVYPASGANAMLPLTPENNWEPTLLFCGGFSGMNDSTWGDYGGPRVDPWKLPASADCQRITPEPADGSAPQYVKDDALPVPRTMGQFISLPDGTLLVINGAAKGTAAYANGTVNTPADQMPFGQSVAADPVLTPAIYDPRAPAGQRWSSAGLQPSKIPRMYHSSAILLPDGSVFVAGSNPNGDYNGTAIYPTEYRAEIFYPPYWGKKRPVPDPETLPLELSYGGPYFNVSLPAGSINDTSVDARVVLVRGGFTTHGMNMGQRHMELNTTYTLAADGSAVLHVSQPPPNAALLTPGPALLFVVVDGVPSTGTIVIIGSGDFGTQPVLAVADLPPTASAPAAGAAASAGASGSGSSSGFHISPYLLYGGGAALAVVVVLAGVLIWCSCRRQRRAERRASMARHPIYGKADFAASEADSRSTLAREKDAFAASPMPHRHASYAA